MMVNLKQIFSLSNIVLDLSVTSKKRALEQAALLFENNEGVARSIVFDSLFARERLGSTALGHGVAIPHGRIPNFSHAKVAFIRTQNPIPFDAPDGESVKLLLVLLVSENSTQQHLEILAALAKILSNEQVREQLKTETDPQTIYHLLTQEYSLGEI